MEIFLEILWTVITWMGIGLGVGLVVFVVALFLKGSKAKGSTCFTRDGYHQEYN